MCDILRTLKTFTGNLKNVQVNLVEASPNLRKTQQEKLLKYLNEDLEMFMSYDMEVSKKDEEGEVDKF